MERILITGAGGQVGRLLAQQAALRGHEVLALPRMQLDITDEDAVREQVDSGDLVVNCAAFTNVDAAEVDPQGAHALNVVGPRNLAHACSAVGARLVHLSTDYVFGGDSTGGSRRPYEIGDATAPLGVYAVTKLRGELEILGSAADATIVRTALVYTGGNGTDFIATMRRLAGATEQTVDVFSNLVGSPTYVNDLVSALIEIVERDIRVPLLHAVNVGEVSRFDLARAIFEEMGADPARVRLSNASAPTQRAPRPAYSALSVVHSASAGLTPLRPWREALAFALAVPPHGEPIPSTP